MAVRVDGRLEETYVPTMSRRGKDPLTEPARRSNRHAADGGYLFPVRTSGASRAAGIPLVTRDWTRLGIRVADRGLRLAAGYAGL